MLDGAGASTFLDLIDERSQVENSNKSIQEVKKFKELKNENGSKELPFTNVPRDQLKRKQIVFIDKQVPDYEKLSKSFRKNVEIHFVETNEDGFKRIEQTLKNGKKYSAIHIIGHGSAGQILFGNALLTNETLDNYKDTLGNIGESLTKKGDILFYGCNIAANDKGEALLKKISNITKADIAASIDLTGKGGDWDLEKKIGIVETQNIKVVDFNYFLKVSQTQESGDANRFDSTIAVNEDGITSVAGRYIRSYTGTDALTDFRGNQERGTRYSQVLDNDDYKWWRISREQTGISSGTISQNNNEDLGIYIVGGGSLTASTSQKYDSYIMFLDDYQNNNSDRQNTATVTFDNNIAAVIYGKNTGYETVGTNGGMSFDSGADYPNSADKDRGIELKKATHPHESSAGSSETGHDWFNINNKTITAGAKNGKPGDFLRVIVEATQDQPPVASNASKEVTENNYSLREQGHYFNLGKDGDISDPDGDSVVVKSFTYQGTNETVTAKDNIGISKIMTQYGTFFLSTNGNYAFDAGLQKVVNSGGTTYDADPNLTRNTATQFNTTNMLDQGDEAEVKISYTVEANGQQATGVITIKINGINDTPVANDDVNSVNEGGTIDRASVQNSNLRVVDNDVDADADDNSGENDFKVTGFASGLEDLKDETLNTFTTIPANGSETIDGNYGTLTMHSDGSYSYSAEMNAAIDSTTAPLKDTFRYRIEDPQGGKNYNAQGSSTSTDPDLNSIGELVITINGVDDVNDAPVTTADTGQVYENFTLTVANDAAANDGYSTSPFDGDFEIAADGDNNSDHGDHTGDILSNDIDTDTLTITEIRLATPESNFEATTFDSVTDVTYSHVSATSITGEYGTLTIGSDGSYEYAATGGTKNIDELDLGDTVKDYFQYKVNDGTNNSLGMITITIKGINDDPVGVNDTDTITYGDDAISVANTDSEALLFDDTDDDGDDDKADFTIHSITATTAGGSAQTTFAGDTETVVGQYGTLVLNKDGSYTYDPTDNANAQALANGVEVDDVFTYVFNDGGFFKDGSNRLTESSGTVKNDPSATATLTITVTGKTPRATDDTGRIEAGSTLTVADGSDGVDGGDGDYDDDSGDHTGDVLENDVGTSTTVTGIAPGGENDGGTVQTIESGSSITINGVNGDLTIYSDGSYTYNANNAGNLLAGETATEVFTYTVKDDTNNTDTATITITILGVDDAPVAVDDTGYIAEGSTLTVEDDEGIKGSDDNYNNESGDTSGGALENDSDADGNDTLLITTYSHTSGTDVSGGSLGTNSNTGTAGSGSVVGLYGTLTLESDGSYTYVANSNIATLDSGLTVTDVFTYTLTDEDTDTADTTATITITIVGVAAPTAEDNTATVQENSSITVANDAAANDSITSATNDELDRAQVKNQDNFGSGVSFSTDGMKMFLTGFENNQIHEYALNPAFDVSTKTLTRSVDLDWNFPVDNSSDSDYSDDQGDWVRGHTWNIDGSKLFVMNWDGGLAGDALASYRVISYDVSTPFDISTISNAAPTSSTSFDIGISNSMRDIKISSDGTKFFFIDRDAKSIKQWALTTAYDLSTASSDTEYVFGNWAALRSLTFSPDGYKLFVGDAKNDKIHQYSLDNSWDVSPGTLTHDGSFALLNDQTQPMGITFGAGGTKLFVHETDGNDMVHEYNLTTPYNLIDVDQEHDGDILENDSDDDGDDLTLASFRTGSVEGSGTAGTFGVALTGTYGDLTLNSNGSYTYDANTGISATEALDAGDVVYDYFNYTISDGSSTATALLTIKIIGVNDNPSVTNDTGYINQDETLTVSNGGAAVAGTSSGSNSGDVLLNETDVDTHDSLVVVGTVQLTQSTDTSGTNLDPALVEQSVGVAVTGTYGDLTLNEDGSYSYIANNAASLTDGQTVTDVFTFTVSDTQGATSTQTLTITVIGQAVVLVNDTDEVNEDDTIVVNDGDAEDLLIDDTAATTITLIEHTSGTDGSGGALPSTASSGAAGAAVVGQYGTLTVAADGSYTYDTDLENNEDALVAGTTATDVFTYTANGETATLTITITGIGPLAANDTASFTEGGAAAEGTAGVSGTGVLGNDDGSSDHDIESLRVTQVKPDGDTYSTINDGGSTTVTSTYGTLTLFSDGSYTYTADQAAVEAITKDATVDDTFVYEIKDDDDINASTANLVITITGINDAIVAVDDTDSVNEGESVNRNNTSEYSLDYDDTDTDSDNTYLTHQITEIRTGSDEGSGTDGTIGNPLVGTYGTLTVQADGSYSYQANNDIRDGGGNRIVSGQSVIDYFNYTVSDTDGATDIAVLTITINGTNEAPNANTDYNSITVGGSPISKTSINGALSNDADMEGDTITVTDIRTGNKDQTGTSGTVGSSLTGTYGTLTINSDGSYTYVLDPNNEDLEKIPQGKEFLETFTYTITDATGQTSTAQIVIEIKGVNDAPNAVNDKDTLDLDTETELINFSDSSKLVTANDTDVDLLDSLSLDSIRSGQLDGSGSTVTIGSAFTSTHGTITFFADGGYNYTANSGLRETLSPGQKLYEYFTYTITDSNGLTAKAQLTIEIFGSTNILEETEEEEAEDVFNPAYDSFKPLYKRASLNQLDPYGLPDRSPLPSSNFYDGQFKILTFNESLKLIDLRAQFKDKDGNYTTFSNGNPDDILVLQFSVFNDPGIQLVKYKGEMKDGSALPSWIKVNPKTGVVVTEIPFDIDLLEFKVIGIDEKNNEYEIAVLIDPKQLRQDRELARGFAGEIQENINVNYDGDVEIQSDEEQSINETENKSINGNEAKAKPKKLIEKIVKGETFKPKPFLRDNKYIINLPDEIKSNIQKGIAILRNGDKAPQWAKVNLEKGELILNPPKNLKNLSLSVITIDADGNKVKNGIETKINKRSAERFAKQIEIKEQSKFVSLTEQVGLEANIQDDYGSDILSRL